MFIELPAFNPDRTSIERRKVWVNPQHVTGIQKMNINGQQAGPNGMPVQIVLGEAYAIMLIGGGQILADASADLSQIVGDDVPVHGTQAK